MRSTRRPNQLSPMSWRKSFEHIIGDSVSAMKPETMTAPASVKANSRNSAPVTPETKPIGA